MVPMVRAASMISGGTLRMPCSVKRMEGTMAYMTMATRAVNSPTRKTIMAGIRNTKMGIVCSVSQVGRSEGRDAVAECGPDAEA